METADGEAIDLDETLRGPRPDIVVTNYSMLEYMLCRPQDQCFFGPGLRGVVLDEAHLYTGTLAAEITLLLRRLYQRCGVDPRKVLQFAASATLGGAGTQDLANFAATIFTKPTELVTVIEGRKTKPPLRDPVHPTAEPTVAVFAGDNWLSGATLEADATGEPRLARDPTQCTPSEKSCRS